MCSVTCGSSIKRVSKILSKTLEKAGSTIEEFADELNSTVRIFLELFLALAP